MPRSRIVSRLASRIGLGLLCLATPLGGALSAGPDSAGEPGTNTRIVHPDETTRVVQAPQFSIRVGKDAQVSPQRGGLDLLVRDPAGFVVKVQSGNAAGAGGLEDSFRKLEQAHLGEGRKWHRKRYQRRADLAGLPALDAVYEGGQANTRVVAVQGPGNDFVLMYFAPPAVFDRQMARFEAMAASFRPVGMPAPPPMAAAPAPEGAGEPAAREPAAETGLAPASRTPATAALAEPAHRFANAQLGYSMDYPAEWLASQETPYMVVFSGAQGTEAYFATVSVQNVQPEGVRSPADAAAAVHSSLKRGLADAGSQARIVADKNIVYEKAGQVLHGHQFLVIYRQNGREFAQWTVILPRAAGTVTHVWSYAAPRRSFDQFRPLASAMLKTFTITGAGAPVFHGEAEKGRAN